LPPDKSRLIYETMEKIYAELERIKVKREEVNNPDIENYLRKITIGNSNSNSRPIRAIRELLKDIEYLLNLTNKLSQKPLQTSRSRDLVKENLKSYLWHSKKKQRERSKSIKRYPRFRAKSRCKCKNCSKKGKHQKSKSQETSKFYKKIDGHNKVLEKTSYNFTPSSNVKQIREPTTSLSLFDPHGSKWFALNEMNDNDENFNFNILYHENFRN
jgi:hypothetical protein